MLWVKAFHIIFVITWFAGLFYLPRLFVYHSTAKDALSHERFSVMERKLLWYIMTPSALLALIFGAWLVSAYPYAAIKEMLWLHAKLGLIVLLFAFHVYCIIVVKRFTRNQNQHSARWYRIFNEIPSLLLIAIVILAVVKPF